jgi:hypothetical protein
MKEGRAKRIEKCGIRSAEFGMKEGRAKKIEKCGIRDGEYGGERVWLAKKGFFLSFRIPNSAFRN